MLLPKKAIRDYFPQVIWIAPPSHKYFQNNRAREMFTNLLEQKIAEKYEAMCCLRLKKFWYENCGALYMKEQRRFTPDGYFTYWRVVDAAVKFWARTLSDMLCKKQKKASYKLNKVGELKPRENKMEYVKAGTQQTQSSFNTFKNSHRSHFDHRTEYRWKNQWHISAARHRRKMPTPPPEKRRHHDTSYRRH